MIPFRIPLSLQTKVMVGGTIIMSAVFFSNPLWQIISVVAGILLAALGLIMTATAPNQSEATPWAWTILYFLTLTLLALAR